MNEKFLKARATATAPTDEQALGTLFADTHDEEDELSGPTLEPTGNVRRVQNMAELHDDTIISQPAGLGDRWREISPEDLPEIWKDLRQWVDWLVVEYAISKQSIPPCWYRHRNIVAELYAMRVAELAVWTNDGPQTTAAFQFHPHLYSMIARLSNIAGACISAKKHVEDVGYGELAPNALVYDESDWDKFIVSTTDKQVLPRAEEGTYWRRRVQFTTPDGEVRELATDPLLVGARLNGPGESLETIRVIQTSTEEVVVSNVAQGHEILLSTWESSNTPEGPWEELTIAQEAPAGGAENTPALKEV